MTNNTTSSKFEGKTDEQLRDLKKTYDFQCNYAFQQQNQFWGSGAHDTAKTFEESAAAFAKQSEEIDAEIKARAQASLTKEQKKAQAEEPVYPDPVLKPADQPTPATQPYEPSTEAQKSESKQQSSRD